MGDNTMNRRQFLKMGASAGACALSCCPSKTATAAEETKEFVGVLVDTTRCTGCRRCEAACAKENGLPIPDIEDQSVFERVRRTDTTAWTVVNRYETDKGIVSIKGQCMHCNQPACAAACLVKAMLKKKDGPVIWRESKCMGCRFCMISCPFDVPKFEYESPNPKIQKCNLCYTRLEKGERPACVESCPVDALMFGARREILTDARARIVNTADRYYPDVYGDTIAGGTGWLYLSSVPFEQIGLNTNLSKIAYPEYTKGFLYGVPVIFVLWPAMLAGMSLLTQRAEKAHAKGETEAVKEQETVEERG